MIEGGFIKNTPYVPIDVLWNDAAQSVSVVLDTGFTGDIKLTKQIADELGLQITGAGQFQMGDGKIVQLPVAVAIASMPGAQLFAEVVIGDNLPLIGIGFLTKFGYKAIVDCKNRVVQLENM